MVTGYSNDLGSFEPDPRVDAIMLLAPAIGATQFPEIVTQVIDQYTVEWCSPGDMDDVRVAAITNT